MHPAIITGIVRSLIVDVWLWGRYHVPQNVFLVIIIIHGEVCLKPVNNEWCQTAATRKPYQLVITLKPETSTTSDCHSCKQIDTSTTVDIWTADKLNNNIKQYIGFQFTETNLHEKHHRICRQQHAAVSCMNDRSVSDSNVNVQYDPALAFVLGHLPALKTQQQTANYLHRIVNDRDSEVYKHCWTNARCYNTKQLCRGRERGSHISGKE